MRVRKLSSVCYTVFVCFSMELAGDAGGGEDECGDVKRERRLGLFFRRDNQNARRSDHQHAFRPLGRFESRLALHTTLADTTQALVGAHFDAEQSLNRLDKSLSSERWTSRHKQPPTQKKKSRNVIIPAISLPAPFALHQSWQQPLHLHLLPIFAPHIQISKCVKTL